MIHQLNMRLSVALLRNADAEMKAKEKAETPVVKTKEQVEKEEELRAKYGTTAKESHTTREKPRSIWRRRFRPLPEAKAVDLFADVIGDTFILAVAGGLVIYEYNRASQKPDANLERIKELDVSLEDIKKKEEVLEEAFEDLRRKEEELEEAEKRQLSRLEAIEVALRAFKDPKTKRSLLPTPDA